MQNLELLTLKEVAQNLKISVETIKSYLYRPGACPDTFPLPVKMNGLNRWIPEDIKKYEDSLLKIDIPSCNQETTSKRRGRGRPRKIS
jgi:predicted DNA-binding transcriptional regulator AlpA